MFVWIPLRSLAFLLLIFFSFLASALEVEVMRLDLRPSGSRVVYKAAFDQQKCEFIPGVEPTFYRDVVTPLGTWQQEQNFLDRLYFGVKEQSIAPDKLRLVLNAADNIELLAIPIKSGGDCIIKRLMNDPAGPKEIGSIEIVLDMTFGVPVLSEVIIENHNNIKYKKSKLRPWDLSGYFPIYEAHVGLGVNIHSNIYKENDKRYWRTDPAIEPVPLALVRIGPFFLNKDGAGVLLLPFEKATLLATFHIDGEPFRADGYRERKKSIYSGFIFKVKDFYTQYFKDIGNVSGGWVANFAWNPEWHLSNQYSISPRIMIQRWDGDYTDYYFGTDVHESPRFGTTYQADPVWNGLYTVTQSYRWGRLKGLLITELKIYGDSVKNSPLTKQRSEFRLITGFLYNLF
tara:strand:- start:6084 stop:7286 length:1203 start_codon:yes stop_codon:yes gene_type:complete